MAQFSHSLVYNRNLNVCPQTACALNAGMGRGIEGLKKIFDVMVDKSKGNILSPLSLGGLVCVRCAKLLEGAHIRFREQFVWEALPGLLGGRWEGV